MNTLYTSLTTPALSSIERVCLPTRKRKDTNTKANPSVVNVLAIIILIAASIFTAPAHAGPNENRLALGNTVLRMLSDYDVVILANIEEFPPYEVSPISDGDIVCINDVCQVHITYAGNCTQDIQLSPSGVGTSHALEDASCMGALWSVDANMSVWTSGLGTDELSNDHPVSMVSLANFMKVDDVVGKITQYESRSVVTVNSVKKKGKRRLTLDASTITRNTLGHDFSDKCRVRVRDMGDDLRVEATCITLPGINFGGSHQRAVVFNLQVDFDVFASTNLVNEKVEVVRSSSGEMRVKTVDLTPGLN